MIASIKEPEVISKILAHIQKTAPDQHEADLPLGARAQTSARCGSCRTATSLRSQVAQSEPATRSRR